MQPSLESVPGAGMNPTGRWFEVRMSPLRGPHTILRYSYSLTEAAVEQRRKAARMRSRDGLGRFLSRVQVQALSENFMRWLHERPGRAGGVARADTAREMNSVASHDLPLSPSANRVLTGHLHCRPFLCCSPVENV